jgi:beta-glucosidase
MTDKKIAECIAQMTLEEKAGLCSGAGNWTLKSVERLDVPQITVTDGPHGLRLQKSGEGAHSVKAVCFPPGCASACSFDTALLEEIGAAIAAHCREEKVDVILGPAVNIKRSPLGGRNFEYYSEDPLLAGELAAAFIRGVQKNGVGTSIKHFLANNQETRRLSGSAEVEERTLREIYMPAFEIAVKKAKPWTVMSSYNKINGEYVSDSGEYLTDVLRGEWGFDGVVVSDWGAVNNRVTNLKAGLDLEMPYSGGERDTEIAEAVRSGRLDEAVLDRAVARILKLIARCTAELEKPPFDLEASHAIASRAAAESAVLLKNEGGVLPLREGTKVAFIGKYAEMPRFQGGGSSHINPYKVASALSCAPKGVLFARGFDDATEEIDESLLREAVDTAKEAEVAIIFAGLPEWKESESFDRRDMRLPNGQNELISRVAAACRRVVVVLHNGSPVEMPWINDVAAVLAMGLGGEAVGEACVDLLYGRANPSGKLAESYPYKLEDTPSYLNFPGERDTVRYVEGVFVGYRYYTTKKMDVLFPFGYGLSYTTFEYSNLNLSADKITDKDTLTVSVDVTNTGDVFGKEIVQIYIAPPADGETVRPARELRAFGKVALQPGETKTVTFTLDKRAFSYYNTAMEDWFVESGTYTVVAARSSVDSAPTAPVFVESTLREKIYYTADTPFCDAKRDPRAFELVSHYMRNMDRMDAIFSPEAFEMLLNYMPLRNVMNMNGYGAKDLEALLEKLNALE